MKRMLDYVCCALLGILGAIATLIIWLAERVANILIPAIYDDDDD